MKRIGFLAYHNLPRFVSAQELQALMNNITTFEALQRTVTQL